MDPFPHHYRVAAGARPIDPVCLSSEGLPDLASAPPAAFGGPGDLWSPETLLLAAVADCYILSFRAVAEASRLEWTRIDCRTEGVLDRVDGVTRFTEITHHVTLQIPQASSEGRAGRLLEKAEAICLVSNSLVAEVVLDTRIEITPQV